MTHVKSLVAMSIEKMLLKTAGKTFLDGIAFMYSAGLSPDRITVMQTTSKKFILQFHSRCDIRPFAANYPQFHRLLKGIVHIRAWQLKSIEFLNICFRMEDVPLLENAIEKLGVGLVLLNNCTYPGVEQGDQAMRLFSALNRKKKTVVCEYGEERLKALINFSPFGRNRTAPVANGPAAGPVADAVVGGGQEAAARLPVRPRQPPPNMDNADGSRPVRRPVAGPLAAALAGPVPAPPRRYLPVRGRAATAPTQGEPPAQRPRQAQQHVRVSTVSPPPSPPSLPNNSPADPNQLSSPRNRYNLRTQSRLNYGK